MHSLQRATALHSEKTNNQGVIGDHLKGCLPQVNLVFLVRKQNIENKSEQTKNTINHHYNQKQQQKQTEDFVLHLACLCYSWWERWSLTNLAYTF